MYFPTLAFPYYCQIVIKLKNQPLCTIAKPSLISIKYQQQECYSAKCRFYQSIKELEAVVQRCSMKKGVLRNFMKLTERHMCQSLFFNKVEGLRPGNVVKKETLTQVFFCEFC